MTLRKLTGVLLVLVGFGDWLFAVWWWQTGRPFPDSAGFLHFVIGAIAIGLGVAALDD